MRREQEGWLWSLSDDDWQHEACATDCIVAGMEELDCRGERWGTITIHPAYRVDVGQLGVHLAEQAVACLTDGTIETLYTEDENALDVVERNLSTAFAADIERVCREHVGTWYEALRGTVTVDVRMHLSEEDADDAGDLGTPTAWNGTAELVEAVRAEWERA